ncbi:MAG: C10 family peptidase, partial [Lachnospiraceae bacterium]|nr:C10 family peptidase [Lachnospiraceae bacterium]
MSQETDIGHCFVVDGIDNQGLYHVNWGWYGQYEGYFDI